MYTSSNQVYTTTTTSYNQSSPLIKQGLTDVEGAKAVARRIFDDFDKGRKGQINNVDCVPMIVKAYSSFNQRFSPSNQDIQSYFTVLDRDGDGKVTLKDLEELCIRYLCPAYQQPIQLQSKVITQVTKTVKYAPEIEAKLDVARRLFNKFDKDGSGRLDENEVAGLLRETYNQMGINFQPTQEDVRLWMDMTDANRDGFVTLSEYEQVVLRSLEKAGFKIVEQNIVF